MAFNYNEMTVPKLKALGREIGLTKLNRKKSASLAVPVVLLRLLLLLPPLQEVEV